MEGDEMSKLLKDIAYGLGVKAFQDGKKCIPASDSMFLDSCIKGTQVGEGIPYSKAWTKGWTKANLTNVK